MFIVSHRVYVVSAFQPIAFHCSLLGNQNHLNHFIQQIFGFGEVVELDLSTALFELQRR